MPVDDDDDDGALEWQAFVTLIARSRIQTLTHGPATPGDGSDMWFILTCFCGEACRPTLLVMMPGVLGRVLVMYAGGVLVMYAGGVLVMYAGV